MTGLFIMILCLLSLACAFLGTRLRIWTLLLAAAWLAFAFMQPTAFLTLASTAILLLLILLPLNVTRWRREYFSAPVLRRYRHMLPDLSATEIAAMEAGTVGWEGELFSGRPDWARLLQQPHLELTTAERAFIEGPVEELCGMLNQWEITHELADLPDEVWAFLKQHHFFGMIIPKAYGGLEFSALAHRAVLQKISSVSSVAGSTVAVPNSLGPGELILHYGTQEQKDYYLPRLANGEEIPCFALTGPTAGSDATSIPDYGVVCKGKHNGKEVIGIRLDFDKRYITLAPVATLIGLAFRLHDPDGLLGDQKDLGISLALIPRDTEGLQIGTRHLPLNVPFQNGPVRGHDVFVPIDALIGGAAYAGKGWKMLVEALSVGRAITLPSSSTGGAKMGSLATGAYARIRKQFNLPIGRFEGVEEALARIGGKTYALSALSRMTATAVDLGQKPAISSAIAKYHATEMAREIITDVMDVHGGKGIILGPRNYLGRAWQGMPIWITVEGANILTRSMMIFGQGAIRCHPYVFKEMQAARSADAEQGLDQFDRLLFAHIGHDLRNAIRSFILGVTGGFGAGTPGGRGRRMAAFYRKLSRYSAALALAADVAMLSLGGKLKQKERLSARLGDVLSQLYICSAMLTRYEARGCPEAERPLLSWAFHNAVFKIQTALTEAIDNFPITGLRLLLKVLIFPTGHRARAPGDRLGHRVAQLLLAPSVTRDQLTDGIYVKAGAKHPIGEMEQALPKIIAAEPLERKLQKATRNGEVSGYTWDARCEDAVQRGILTDDDAEALRLARELSLEIIAVDEFEPEKLRAGNAAAQSDSRDSQAA